MSAGKKPVKKAAGKTAPAKAEPAPPSGRFPEHKGTPLRPEQFPSVEQLAHLAASFARSLPEGAEKAESLVQSALSLWLAARDAINERGRQAGEYWRKMDQSQRGIEEGYTQVALRLEKMGASELAGILVGSGEAGDGRLLSWEEAETLLFPDLSSSGKSRELAVLVTDALLGTEGWWRLWEMADFKKLGFDRMAVITLIQIFDRRENERENAATSQRMRDLRAKRPRKTPWGKLGKPTSRKKGT